MSFLIHVLISVAHRRIISGQDRIFQAMEKCKKHIKHISREENKTKQNSL